MTQVDDGEASWLGQQSLDDLLKALQQIDSTERIAAAPRRMAMDAGRECLVVWQPDSVGGDWTLTLTERATDPEVREAPAARLALHLPHDDRPVTSHWEGESQSFQPWLREHLPGVIADIAADQPAIRAATIARAGLTETRAKKLGELLPHVVVVAAIVAFVYMFGVVHIH